MSEQRSTIEEALTPLGQPEVQSVRVLIRQCNQRIRDFADHISEGVGEHVYSYIDLHLDQNLITLRLGNTGHIYLSCTLGDALAGPDTWEDVIDEFNNGEFSWCVSKIKN